MNNSVFGKTMENVRKRGNYELVYSSQRIEKLFSSRWFKNMILISKDLALIERYPKQIKLNKPLQIGAQILDLSKITLIDFYYDHLLKEYKQVDLIATDTDSLIVKIIPKNNEDLYESMWKNR